MTDDAASISLGGGHSVWPRNHPSFLSSSSHPDPAVRRRVQCFIRVQRDNVHPLHSVGPLFFHTGLDTYQNTVLNCCNSASDLPRLQLNNFILPPFFPNIPRMFLLRFPSRHLPAHRSPHSSLSSPIVRSSASPFISSCAILSLIAYLDRITAMGICNQHDASFSFVRATRPQWGVCQGKCIFL